MVTAVILGAVLSKTEVYQNHTTGPLPFPPGMYEEPVLELDLGCVLTV